MGAWLSGLDVPAWAGSALIGAVVAAFGWLANARITAGHERRRRREKERDLQVALRAEIRPEWIQAGEVDLDALYKATAERYATDPSYSVSVPTPSRLVIYEAIIKDIHILPERVIDPIVYFARQHRVSATFADDLRDDGFAKLDRARQLEMFRDYLSTVKTTQDLAKEAHDALEASLKSPRR